MTAILMILIFICFLMVALALGLAAIVIIEMAPLDQRPIQDRRKGF
jgi:hypothetical protein